MLDILTLEEACSVLKLSKPTLYTYVRRGDIPAFKMGRAWKFHRESLDLWMKNRISEDTKLRSEKCKGPTKEIE